MSEPQDGSEHRPSRSPQEGGAETALTAERLIAGFVERNGARITDGVEREIGNRALRG